MNFLAWGTPHHRTASGRLHVTCRKGHGYWLGPREMNWSVCAHCVRWWRLTPQ